MKTILVTGCAGFIGSHVCEKLLTEGNKVLGIDNFDSFYAREIKETNLSSFINHPNFTFFELDITKDLDNLPGSNIDAIVHLAAKAGVRPSIIDPEGYYHTNIYGTQKVHNFIKTNKIKKFVFASSSSVYGNNTKVPFNELDFVDHPISPYAFTKKAGELMNYTFHHLYNVDIINLRFFTVYGPRQRPDLAINKFIRKVFHNEPLHLYGNGSTARDYTYIDDIASGVCAALDYCINNDNVFETINLGNNKPVKLNDLTTIIYEVMKKEKNLVFEPMQPGDVEVTFADITKASELLKYCPTVSIDVGIKKYVDWYIGQIQ